MSKKANSSATAETGSGWVRFNWPQQEKVTVQVRLCAFCTVEMIKAGFVLTSAEGTP